MPRAPKRPVSDDDEDDRRVHDSDSDGDASDDSSVAEAPKVVKAGAAVAPLGPPAKKAVVLSNKTLDQSRVPPKPAVGPLPAGGASPVVSRPKKSLPFHWRMTFTNGSMLRKFLEPAAHAVKKMRFVICHTEAFKGFRIECHDQAFTLADRGIFECDVELGPSAKTDDYFCVTAEAFMEALQASTLKETDLRLTRYVKSEDRITFESVSNENDVRAMYSCGLVDSSQVETLDGISINLGFHVNVNMSTLKELSLNAKRCGASTLRFQLFQAADPTDAQVVHSKMCIGFEGLNTAGTHDFFISCKRETGPEGPIWAPVTSGGLEALDGLKLEARCDNEYDNKKLRLFLNHMDCQWVMVHLCTDNTQQPLVLDCILGGSKTKHTVIVAPKDPGAT